MSVIGYGKHSIIDMLAATWSHGSAASSDGRKQLELAAIAGNLIQEANHMAYFHTYHEGERDTPITVREITSAMIGLTVDQRLRGMRTLRGMRYNLIANDGTDFATLEILDALLGLHAGALARSESNVGFAA